MGRTMGKPFPLPKNDESAFMEAPPEAPPEASPSDDWFGPMSQGGDCAAPPRMASLMASSTRFVIIIDPDIPGLEDEIAEVGTVSKPYAVLPVLELEANPADVLRLQGRPGIVAALPALGGMASMRTLALGFDFLAAFSRAQNQQVSGQPYGGRASGDAGGYPVLVQRDDAWVLDIDEDTDWPAPMALVPAVSFSVGPRSASYPFLANDIVSLATLLASRDVLVVAAAGNCGALGEGTVSAWAQPPWVLAVGATTDEEGTTLAPFSSRGLPDNPGTAPDVVAFGRSTIAPHPEGTSFAAPRVAHLARLVTAALCQLGRQVRLAQGAEPHGVPLVGLGMIDVFGDRLTHFPVDLSLAQALPIVGVDATSVRAATTMAEEAGLHVDVQVTPEFLRTFLLDCATEMPGYAPHEVGRGFIDANRVRGRLSSLTFSDIVGWFAATPADAGVAERLAEHRVFIPSELDLLDRVLRSTGPHVRYDYRTQDVAVLPVAE